MTAREWLFAGVLLAAGALVVGGCATVSRGLGLVVAGVLLAGWSWLILGELDGPAPSEPDEVA